MTQPKDDRDPDDNFLNPEIRAEAEMTRQFIWIMLADPLDKNRGIAADILQFSKSDTATEALESAALDDAWTAGRINAARSLTVIASNQTEDERRLPVEVIGYVLQNSSDDVKVKVMDICNLVELNHSVLIPVVRPLMTSKDLQVKSAAIDVVRFAALFEDNKAAEALPELMSALDDPASKNRAAQAIGALNKKGESAVPKLAFMSANPLSHSVDVSNALARITEDFRAIAASQEIPYSAAVKGGNDSLPPIESKLDATPDWATYHASVMSKVVKTWQPPKGAERQLVAVSLLIQPDGQPSQVQVRISGGESADAAALQAIADAGPFDPPPPDAQSGMNTDITFDYDFFKSGNAGKVQPVAKPPGNDLSNCFYLSSLKRMVAMGWRLNDYNVSSSCAMTFSLDTAGNIKDIKIVEPSGNWLNDNVARSALACSGPLGPLPANLLKHKDWKINLDYVRSPVKGVSSTITLQEYKKNWPNLR